MATRFNVVPASWHRTKAATKGTLRESLHVDPNGVEFFSEMTRYCTLAEMARVLGSHDFEVYVRCGNDAIAVVTVQPFGDTLQAVVR